jgi:DNA polymerase-3 subunit delta'
MARAPAVQEIEVLPEADRLGEFPHPRETVELYGQETAEATLAQAFASGRMHHGWILGGPPGIGKATLAYRLAVHALAAPQERDPSGQSLRVPTQSIAARQVRALSHPGLLVLRRPYDVKAKRFATSIPVDEVRRLKSFLSRTADAESWRVVIVDTADDLNTNAANAILKALEEPPPRVIFLLISSQPGRLLPTIRSRCRVLALPALPRPSLQKAVRQAFAATEDEEPVAADPAALERLAGGSVRRALSLLGGGGLDLDARIARAFSGLPRVDWLDVHALGDELAGSAAEQKFELFFELFLDRVARLARAAATGEGAADDLQLAGKQVAGERLATFAELWETVTRELADTLSLNLDRKTLVLATFAHLESAASRSAKR